MTAVVRCGTLVGLLVFCVACDGRPTAPGSLPPRPSTFPTPLTPPLPPLSGPSTTYHFLAPLDYPLVSGSHTPTSKYVLYDNGAYSFRYESLGVTYTGSYQREDGRIIFDPAAARPGAEPPTIGTLNGDLLEVRYSFWVRVGADFENAVYQRTE